MTVRKCGTCKHYEPAPFWRRGWCRNPLLYSPQQSHLVDEDDLDCDRGMGNHWEPVPQPEFEQSVATGSFGYIPLQRSEHGNLESTAENEPAFRSDVSGGRGGPARRGGDVSQFGGSGRPGGGGYGGDDGGDDRDFPPFGESGDETGRFGPGRQFDYQVEERYWTDYLRIALPVLGVIILLGLVWFWVASLLGDPNDDENNDVTPDVSGPVIVDESPTPDEQEGDDDQEPPLAVTTPTPEPTDEQEAPPSGVIEPGATVVVANTGGSGLNMRAAPSTTAEVQQELEDGATLTVTGESVEAEGYTWWPVESATATGFVVANFVELSN